MSDIKFSKEETAVLVDKLTTYLDQELDQSITQFECEFLLDFISDELGAYFYNKGLRDAQVIVSKKADDIVYAIDELEKPTGF